MVDVGIQEAIGRFFAAKLRAAVYYELFVRTGSPPAIGAAVRHCRAARSAWSEAAARAPDAYAHDLAFGPQPWLRGTWSDRLPAIDADLEALEELAQRSEPLRPGPGRESELELERALKRLVGLLTSRPGGVELTHRPPDGFRRGDAIPLELVAGGTAPDEVAGVAVRKVAHPPLPRLAGPAGRGDEAVLRSALEEEVDPFPSGKGIVLLVGDLVALDAAGHRVVAVEDLHPELLDRAVAAESGREEIEVGQVGILSNTIAADAGQA